MALSRQRISTFIGELRKLAQQANLSQTSLVEYEKVLNRIIGKDLTFVSFKNLITNLESLSTELKNLGADAQRVDKLTASLTKLSGVSRLTLSEVKQLTPGAAGAQAVGPEQITARRFAQILKSLNLSYTDISGNEEFQKLFNTIAETTAQQAEDLRSSIEHKALVTRSKISDTISKEENLKQVLSQTGKRLRTLGTGPLPDEQRIERARLEQLYYRVQDEITTLEERLRRLQTQEARFERRATAFDRAERGRRAPAGPTQLDFEGAGIDEPSTIQNLQFYRSLESVGVNTAGLRKQLEELGVTADAVASQPLTDLSTGITKVTFTAENGAGGIQKYTAHIDQFGNVLKDQQKRFRTFGDAIVRDTIEVLKWTIAIGIVYGPMRKLTELMKEAAQIQESLVDVQIVLGGETEKLSDIFKSAVAVANETSSAVTGVIAGYNEALAATAGIATEAERLVTTQILLKDSMLLSKLAGLDQSKALDVLVGALRQQNLTLAEGSKLLDSWVAVSRNANVSLNQLATTFAIAGSAADEAGIGFHELNALVGALAEATTLSADEVGNAIRGFISGFQSETAEQQLARFGIAVRNTEGQIRSFTDLMRELAVLSDKGILSPRDLAELTNAIGGGFRRGAQLSAVLGEYPKILDLITVSQNASGDSSEALEIKMSTLQSAITRLQNSFTSLAVTLGGEGGALSVLTLLADILTSVTGAVSGLISVLGIAAPILSLTGLTRAALGTATAGTYTGRQIPRTWARLFTPTLEQQRVSGQPVLRRIVQTGMLMGEPTYGYESIAGAGLLGMRGPGLQRAELTGTMQRASYQYFFTQLYQILNDSYSGFFQKLGGLFGRIPLLGGVGRGIGGIGAAGIGGILGVGVVAGSAAAQGNLQKAGVAMAGGLLGAMTGNPLLAVAGSAMATAFYDQFLTYEGDLKQRWAQILLEAQVEAGITKPGEDAAKTIDQIIKEDLSAFENIALGGIQLLYRASQVATSLVAGVVGERAGPRFREMAAGTERYGKIEKEDVATFFALQGIYLSPENRKAILNAMEEFVTENVTSGLETTRLEDIRIREAEAVSVLAATTAQGLVEQALDEIGRSASGSVQQYLDAKKLATQIESAVGGFFAAMTVALEVGAVGGGVPSRETAVEVFAKATEDERKIIAQLSESILDMQKNLAGLLLEPIGERTEEDTQRINELNTAIRNTSQELEKVFEMTEQAARVRHVEATVLGTIDIPDEVPPEKIPEILQAADLFWTDLLEMWGLSDEYIEAFKDAQQKKLITLGGDLTNIFTAIPQEQISRAVEQFGFGAAQDFQFLDLRDKLTMGQMPELFNRYAKIVTAFKQMGYTPEFQDVSIIWKDGFSQNHIDMMLLNLALQDLIDIEKEKGITGIYNLPEGATFYVPLEAFELDQATRAGMGGGGGMQWAETLFDKYATDQEALIEAMRGVQGEEPKTVLGIPLENVRRIISENITDVGERQALGARGPLATLPVEEFSKYLESLGISPEPTQEGTIIRLDTERNAVLNQIHSEVVDFNNGLQTLDTTIQNINGITETPEEEARRFRPPFPEGQSLDITPPAENLEQVQQARGGLGDIINGIIEWWNSLEKRPLLPVHPDELNQRNYFIPPTDMTQAQPISTRLNLEMESNIQLVVDGRTLANIIKPYIYEDLLRYESTGSVTIRRSILT